MARTLRTPARTQRQQSINNLKQIALAMHNFESAYGAFPPAVIYGPDNKLWHSWCVLILPFLDRRDLYNAYDFTQPWDSPKNKALVDRMPPVYRDPIYGEAIEHSYTHYAVLLALPRFSGPRERSRPTPRSRRSAPGACESQ